MMEQLCQKVLRATSSGRQLGSWTIPSVRHCSQVRHWLSWSSGSTKHITKVNNNGGKSRGCKNATYHSMLINWAMAFVARISARIYNKVAKIMMLPHIYTICRKTAELITTTRFTVCT